jgi:hypothetical protein
MTVHRTDVLDRTKRPQTKTYQTYLVEQLNARKVLPYLIQFSLETDELEVMPEDVLDISSKDAVETVNMILFLLSTKLPLLCCDMNCSYRVYRVTSYVTGDMHQDHAHRGPRLEVRTQTLQPLFDINESRMPIPCRIR